ARRCHPPQPRVSICRGCGSVSPVLCLSYLLRSTLASFVFFFNDTATTEIYTLSLHDALPICQQRGRLHRVAHLDLDAMGARGGRSEEHTSELQSLTNLVCRLLLEKKKKTKKQHKNQRRI